MGGAGGVQAKHSVRSLSSTVGSTATPLFDLQQAKGGKGRHTCASWVNMLLKEPRHLHILFQIICLTSISHGRGLAKRLLINRRFKRPAGVPAQALKVSASHGQQKKRLLFPYFRAPVPNQGNSPKLPSFMVGDSPPPRYFQDFVALCFPASPLKEPLKQPPKTKCTPCLSHPPIICLQ